MWTRSTASTKHSKMPFSRYVENGSITLIGATTENPSFELNSALLSRSKVFVLHPLSVEDIVGLLNRSLADTVNGLGAEVIRIDPSLIEQMAVFANGDARTAYNTLEIAAQLAPSDEDGIKTVTPGVLEDAFQKRMLLYDKAGEEHYNLISALHKSMRNSDPDATLYWLGRMLESGEDPLYIARRIVRFASEDVGMADPMALPLPSARCRRLTSLACQREIWPWRKRPSIWQRHRNQTRCIEPMALSFKT